MGRITGRFANRPLPTLRVSLIALVPKKESNDCRLKHHLSYPFRSSVNDFIDSKHCSVQYTSFDEAIHLVQDLGRSCQPFKSYVSNAFPCFFRWQFQSLTSLGLRFKGNIT